MESQNSSQRAKLYALNAAQRWDDCGTGQVTTSYDDRFDGVKLVILSDHDGSVLLETKVRLGIVYEKQRDKFIIWTDADNSTYSLSFQKTAGREKIWEEISRVQNEHQSVEYLAEVATRREDQVVLPSCELQHLEEISEVISNCQDNRLLAEALKQENYIKQLLNLLHICEHQDDQEGLRCLFEIFKNILRLNRIELFEVMFSTDTILDVFGCLEYSEPPRRHRQHFKQLSKFREPIPIKNPELVALIHQTFQVQYVQDVVLPAPPDAELRSLSKFISLNKCKIVTLIQEDEGYLNDLLATLDDFTTPLPQRRDCVLLLKEFFGYAQLLQPIEKGSFYKSLISLGVLSALQNILIVPDSTVKSASIDILMNVVEFSPSFIHDYALLERQNNVDQSLINIVIKQILIDSKHETGRADQLMRILLRMLDPNTMSMAKMPKFLNFFYEQSFQILIGPLMINDNSAAGENYLTMILELLSFCVKEHNYYMKKWINTKDLLSRISVLMQSRNTFVTLSALRFLRQIISMKDDEYNRYIVNGDHFAPVLEALLRNKGRNNLLESAILALFEVINEENITILCDYVVEKSGEIIGELKLVKILENLRKKHDQRNQPQNKRCGSKKSSTPLITLRRSLRRLSILQLSKEDDLKDTKTLPEPVNNKTLDKKAGLKGYQRDLEQPSTVDSSESNASHEIRKTSKTAPTSLEILENLQPIDEQQSVEGLKSIDEQQSVEELQIFKDLNLSNEQQLLEELLTHDEFLIIEDLLKELQIDSEYEPSTELPQNSQVETDDLEVAVKYSDLNSCSADLATIGTTIPDAIDRSMRNHTMHQLVESNSEASDVVQSNIEHELNLIRSTIDSGIARNSRVLNEHLLNLKTSVNKDEPTVGEFKQLEEELEMRKTMRNELEVKIRSIPDNFSSVEELKLAMSFVLRAFIATHEDFTSTKMKAEELKAKCEAYDERIYQINNDEILKREESKKITIEALPALRRSKEHKETKPQVQTTFASPKQPNACSTLANTTIDIDTIKTPKHERVGIYVKYFQSTSKFKVEPVAPKIMEIGILDSVKSNPKITTSPVFDDDECVDEPKKKTRGKYKRRGSRRFVCVFCGKSLPRVQSLRRHEAVCMLNKSSEVSTCHYCGKKFVYEKSRCKHEAVCAPHKDRRQFRCGKCDKVYTYKTSLTRHYRDAHK